MIKAGGYLLAIQSIFYEARQKNTERISELSKRIWDMTQDPEALAFIISEISEVLVRFDLTKEINESLVKATANLEYNLTLYISWVNFLKLCKAEWNDISDVFKKAYEKAKNLSDFEELWKIELFTCRSYCNDINIIRELEQKYIQRKESKNENAGDAGVGKKKRKLFTDANPTNVGDGNLEQIKKHVKTN